MVAPDNIQFIAAHVMNREGPDILSPIVDFHAHWTPRRYRDAIAERGTWYGLDGRVGELHNSGFLLSVDERIEDMDRVGVDVQLLSPAAGFYQYTNRIGVARVVARECNDEISEIVAAHPDRFVGCGILPMQDIPAAIEELERVAGRLGFKAVMIGDHVRGKTYDLEEFEPFWETVEQLGTLVFFHQGFDYRFDIGRYFLNNTVGHLVDRAITYAVLATGGVLDRHPDLNLLLGHAGGYSCFGVSRMDKAAGAFSEDRHLAVEGRDAGYRSTPQYVSSAQRPPSDYLRCFYYDSCTYSGETLRFLLDSVGADRVVLGTDTPAPMVLTNGVRWIQGLECLTEREKHCILRDNAGGLLGDGTFLSSVR